MRIRVDFSIEIPAASYASLCEAAAAPDLRTAREFVKCEALYYLMDYLAQNGVEGVRVTREF